MQRVKQSLTTDCEELIDTFINMDGMYSVMSVLKCGEMKVIGEAFDIIPRLLTHQSARDQMKSKLEFFTQLYEFMEHPHQGLRTICCQMLTKIA